MGIRISKLPGELGGGWATRGRPPAASRGHSSSRGVADWLTRYVPRNRGPGWARSRRQAAVKRGGHWACKRERPTARTFPGGSPADRARGAALSAVSRPHCAYSLRHAAGTLQARCRHAAGTLQARCRHDDPPHDWNDATGTDISWSPMARVKRTASPMGHWPVHLVVAWGGGNGILISI